MESTAYWMESHDSMSVYLRGQTEAEIRLIQKFRDVVAEEINEHIAIDDWDIKGLVEIGGIMTAFLEAMIKKMEDAEDEAV